MRVYLFALAVACIVSPPLYGAWWLDTANAACKPENVVTEANLGIASVIGHGITIRSLGDTHRKQQVLGYNVTTRCGSDSEIQGIQSGAILPKPLPNQGNNGRPLKFTFTTLPNGVIVKE